MQYTCVAIIAARPGHLDEVLRKSELELMPLYRDVPGFVAYTVAKTGDSAAIAFSLWQTPMQYTCVAIIAARPGHLDEVLRKSELELLPLYRDLPGFVAYTVAKTGDSAAIAFSLWQTRQQAEQSIRTSETWMQEGTAGLIDSIKNHVGELPFLAFSRDLSVYASPAAAPAGRLV